jgi:flavin reductase (DIM6/NTAB) family NADH-FMN oxidoreductase RutF
MSKKRRPWNRVAEQVYSISSIGADAKTNMNIATYVVPVTMDIKRYAIAVYRNSKTHENVVKNSDNTHFILQGLQLTQMALVRVLGKKSGRVYDKESYLKKHTSLISVETDFKNFSYLPNNAFTLHMQTEKIVLLGDHDIVIAKVMSVLQNDADAQLLTTKELQDAHIIG